MADGAACFAHRFVDDEEDGFVAFLAFLEALDEAYHVGVGLVEGSGDEFLADGYGTLFLAADVGVGCDGEADAEGLAGVPVVDDELTQVGMDGDELEAVEAGWEHTLGGFEGVGEGLVVDDEGAGGVEVVGLGSVNDYVHNCLVFRA